MLEREFFDHEDPDGALPWDRLREVEYAFYDANETIAIGALSPSEVMDEIWMPRDGSCAALMAAEFEEVGVGAGGSVGPDLAFTRAWTVLVALPR
jgi:uncharacterized protein YkwD